MSNFLFNIFINLIHFFIMKRKLFTLLFALVAVVAFQANAQTTTWATDVPSNSTATLEHGPYSSVKYWIKVDKTGFNANTDTIAPLTAPIPYYDAYPYDKYGFYNWFTATPSGTVTTSSNAGKDPEAIYKDPAALYTVNLINNNPKRFEFIDKNSRRFSSIYGTQTNVQFEVVRINDDWEFESQAFSGAYTTQEGAADSSIVAGYLSIPNTYGYAQPWNDDLLLVGYTNSADRVAKKFKDVAIYAASINPNPLLVPQGKCVNGKWQATKDKVPGLLYSAYNSSFWIETYVDGGKPYFDSISEVEQIEAGVYDAATFDVGGLISASGATPGTAGALLDTRLFWNSTTDPVVAYLANNGLGSTIEGAADSIYTYLAIPLRYTKGNKGEGEIYFRDSVKTLSYLATTYPNSVARDSVGDFKDITASGNTPYVGHWYIKIQDGILAVTFPRRFAAPDSDAYTKAENWTNGLPTNFDDYYYHLDVVNPSGSGLATFQTDLNAIFLELGLTAAEAAGNATARLAEIQTQNTDPINAGAPDEGNSGGAGAAGRYFNVACDGWQPYYIYITPSCPSTYFDYVSKEWLGQYQLDLVPNKHQLAIYNPSIGGTYESVNAWIGDDATIYKSSDEATGILYERAAFIDENGDLNLLDGTVIASGFQIPIDTIDIYRIINTNEQYLTVAADGSDFSDVGTVNYVINGLQAKWEDGIAEDDPYFATQLFAVMGTYDAQSPYGLTYNADEKKYQSFLYIPLASYKWIPSKQVYERDGNGELVLYYNEYVGDSTINHCGQPRYVADSLWYVSQYSQTGKDQKLVVADPLERGAFTRLYVDLFDTFEACDLPCGSTGFTLIDAADGLYAINALNGDTIHGKDAAEAITAHWFGEKLNSGKWTIHSEIDSIFDCAALKSGLAGNALDGPYLVSCDGEGNYTLISGDYSPYERSTYKIECVESHETGFKNIDQYVGASDLSLIENTWLNRNLGIINKFGKVTYIDNAGVVQEEGVETDTIIATITSGKQEGIKDTVWVKVYASNRRYLGANNTHLVPYYLFAIEQNGKEYFLNVVGDQVLWTALPTADLTALVDYEANPNFKNNYKFCLPILSDDNDVNDPAGDEFYLLTLESLATADACNSKTLKLVAPNGSATDIVKAYDFVDYPAGVLTAGAGATFNYINGIYSFNAGDIDINVAGWTDYDKAFDAIEWVDIQRAIQAEDSTAVGVFTSNIIDITTDFVGIAVDEDYLYTGVKDDDDVIYYGKLYSLENAQQFTLEYTGKTKIGYNKRDIWYYRIKSNQGYLTDATGSGAGATPAKADTASYIFNTNAYHYGYFTKALDQKTADGVKYDERFVQTFGFKRVTPPDAEIADTIFRIVSAADFGTVNPDLRYVGMVNERLVFVENEKDATQFQWGDKIDGKYVNIKAVAEGQVYGVKGGVRVAGIEGNVDVFSLEGRLIRSTSISGDTTIDTPAGIYLVKTGANVTKVVVK
jgi:hypothetical protein